MPPSEPKSKPWLLPSNRRLRNLVSLSLRNLTLTPTPSSTPSRIRGKTIDDDALPHTLVSPAKLLALREKKDLNHSRSSNELRRVAEHQHERDLDHGREQVHGNVGGPVALVNGEGDGNGSPVKSAHRLSQSQTQVQPQQQHQQQSQLEQPQQSQPQDVTPRRPTMPRMLRRRRSTIEWANATPARRQEKLESVTAERLGDVFFSLHVAGVEEPVYISEVVAQTMNPTFRHVDLSACAPGVARLESVMARFWVKSARWREWRQLLELNVALPALQYLGKSLDQLQRPLPPNAAIFHLVDGVYTVPTALSPFNPPISSIPLKTSSTRTLPTSTFDAILRLAKLDDSIQDALATRNALATQLHSLLTLHNPSLASRDALAQASDRQETITYASHTVRKQLEKAARQQAQKRASLLSRRNLMVADLTSRATARAEQLALQPDQLLPALRSQHQVHQKALRAQRRRLAADLQLCFPLLPVPKHTLAFTLRGMHLPDANALDSVPAPQVAAALGWVAQIVLLLSKYLSDGQVLPYPVLPQGSRSAIVDPVALLKTSATSATKTTGKAKDEEEVAKAALAARTYPLFALGVPRFRFEYAVFLLGKDLQVLLEWVGGAGGAGVRGGDLSQLLPNLALLFYVLGASSTAAGQLDEETLVGRRVGSIRGLDGVGRDGSEIGSGVKAKEGNEDVMAEAFEGLLWDTGGKKAAKGAIESLRLLAPS